MRHLTNPLCRLPELTNNTKTRNSGIDLSSDRPTITRPNTKVHLVHKLFRWLRKRINILFIKLPKLNVKADDTAEVSVRMENA